MKIWSREFNETPYWTNPDNGLEWFIDKETTRWCTESRASLPKLEAVCFYVVESIEDKKIPLSLILIDKKTNGILAEKKGPLIMASYIDMLRASLMFDE